MWYELLPYLGIMGGAYFVACNLGLPEAYLWHKGKHPRASIHLLDNYCFARDKKLTGHMYKVQGLDALPDAAE